MYIQELSAKRRSIRKFRQESVAHDDLLALVELSRTSASAAKPTTVKVRCCGRTGIVPGGIFPCELGRVSAGLESHIPGSTTGVYCGVWRYDDFK